MKPVDFLRCLSLIGLLGLGTASRAQNAADDSELQLVVIDPYAELRTGPGRGYPVFYALEEGESVTVLTRRPGWFEVRAASGQRGWTSTGELSRTMQANGLPADLPTVSYGDYLEKDWRVGFSGGAFVDGELDDADTLSIRGGYRILSWLELELEWGRLFGNDSRGDYYAFNLQLEPFTQYRLSPFLAVGVGEMSIDEQPKLVPLEIDSSDFESYTLGGRYYLGRNFLLQAGYRWYSVDAGSDQERLESVTFGFSAFF